MNTTHVIIQQLGLVIGIARLAILFYTLCSINSYTLWTVSYLTWITDIIFQIIGHLASLTQARIICIQLISVLACTTVVVLNWNNILTICSILTLIVYKGVIRCTLSALISATCYAIWVNFIAISCNALIIWI